MSTEKDRRIMRRMVAQLRDDLLTICECEAAGGLDAVHGDGPLRFEPDVVEGVLDLIALILEAEALVGREPGPEWLDAAIDGRRRIEVVERVS